MIAVTGANGNLGGAVVRQLLRLVPPSHVVACVRDSANAGPNASRAGKVRHGDYDDRASLIQAFAGADQLLIVSSSGIDHERRARQHRNAIDAAVEAGVGHVYYTSLLPCHGSVAYVMKAHLDTEAYLESSGLIFTVLKNAAYIEAWPRYLGDISGAEAVVPDDGPVTWVARDDLAEGTARLIVQDGYFNQTIALTGTETFDIAGMAHELSRVRGRTIVQRIVTPDEYIRRQVAAGKPAEFARRWATTYTGMARGEFCGTDPLLKNLLGRPLRTVDQVLSASDSRD